jgi:hypothetical protein
MMKSSNTIPMKGMTHQVIQTINMRGGTGNENAKTHVGTLG